MTERIDTLSFFDATAALPEQVEAAALAADALPGLPLLEEIENVVVFGMGGSGIAGDVMAAIAGPFMPVPIVVSKGYETPSFVSDTTLCFALSFSGDTEETVEAASGAAVVGARMVVVAKGGELGRLAEPWHASFIAVPDDIPKPRAGLGALAIPPLAVLDRIGLFPGAAGWIDQAVDQLKRRRDELVKDANPARELARRIGRTLPMVWGGGEVGGTAAMRWRNQINENAKAPAFASVLPELTHNEICGWGQHGDVTRQVFTLLFLRHGHEHPQVARRFDLVREVMEEIVAGIEEIHAAGDGALAQLFDLVMFGDFVSLYLAFQEGVDPGPIPVLDQIKESLSAP